MSLHAGLFYELLLLSVILVNSAVVLFTVFRKPQVGKLNINFDREIFGLLNDSGHVYPSQLTFKIVGSGISQMLFANRNGDIEARLRTRKIPISIQIGSCKITLIIDARAYKKELPRLSGVLTLFEPDGSADLRSSLTDVQTILALHDGDLNKPNSVSYEGAKKSCDYSESEPRCVI